VVIAVDTTRLSQNSETVEQMSLSTICTLEAKSRTEMIDARVPWV
jgi:hypothetical protein